MTGDPFSKRRVLVTGCGGFLGKEIVRQLLERGDAVVGVSRNHYRELESLGMQARCGDLTNRSFVATVVEGVDAIIHTAAKAGVWGDWNDYFAINTRATADLLDACRAAGIKNFVFSSSPSVTFDATHQSGVDESIPYASRWLCHYPHTKALAEQNVLASHKTGVLNTVALRPHLIWSEDDPHILPRVLQRSKQGRLRIIGDGKNRIDTVHVINAAASHLDALDALERDPERAGGRAYFITQDEPVACWDWISEVCRIGDAPPPTKRISLRAAYRIGFLLEKVFAGMRIRSEPPMTRFVAAQLALDHYFDIRSARERLGYSPRVTMEQGLDRLRAKWRGA